MSEKGCSVRYHAGLMMGQVRSGRGGQGHPPHRPTECKPLHSASNSLPPGNHGDQDWASRDCRDLTTRPRVMNPITGRLTRSNMAAAWLLERVRPVC